MSRLISLSPVSVSDPAFAALHRRRRGMTLLEVMIATFVLFIVTGGILGVLISTYRLTASTRHADNARAMLASFGDQFSRLNPIDLTLPNPTNPVALPLWQATGPTPTGVGLTWGTAVGDLNGLPVTLGSSTGSLIPALVFRQVSFVQTSYPFDAGCGSDLVTSADMVRATFTIVYTLNGLQKTQSLTVARLWKNAN